MLRSVRDRLGDACQVGVTARNLGDLLSAAAVSTIVAGWESYSSVFCFGWVGVAHEEHFRENQPKYLTAVYLQHRPGEWSVLNGFSATSQECKVAEQSLGLYVVERPKDLVVTVDGERGILRTGMVALREGLETAFTSSSTGSSFTSPRLLDRLTAYERVLRSKDYGNGMRLSASFFGEPCRWTQSP